MTEDVKRCIDMRTDFFDAYFTVPEDVRGEVDDLVRDMTALGERCGSAAEFEECFASQGLSERFNAALARCVQKPMKRTKEQKQQSTKIAREMLRDNRAALAKDAVEQLAGAVQVEAESRFFQKRREEMIENGTFDEYTRTNNAVDALGGVVRFFKKKLGGE
ncbi:MAG: hypothetical protein VB092_04975 [Oscillospiraceae bacterium]|nr:hypothetical protein [Oscillospiraceae bacterium]